MVEQRCAMDLVPCQSLIPSDFTFYYWCFPCLERSLRCCVCLASFLYPSRSWIDQRWVSGPNWFFSKFWCKLLVTEKFLLTGIKSYSNRINQTPCVCCSPRLLVWKNETKKQEKADPRGRERITNTGWVLGTGILNCVSISACLSRFLSLATKQPR
jgi:hypothetical protein